MTRILIVEDEAITALDLKLSLEELGYEIVDVVDNAQDAIDVAFEKTPDITIMDINLKGEENGIYAAEKLNEFNLPVLYLTAYTDDDTFTKALENASGYAFVSKPFDIDKIAMHIEYIVNRSKIEDTKLDLAYGFE